MVQVVDMVVGPLLVALVNSCGGCGVAESSVYLLNCYHQLHSTISLLHTTNSQHKLNQIEVTELRNFFVVVILRN